MINEMTIDYKAKGFFNKQDRQRKEALESRDALRYFNLCNRMGVEPEDGKLYEVGTLEYNLLTGKMKI